MTDYLDPTAWSSVPMLRVLYLDNTASLRALIDEEDFVWAQQWLWTSTPNSTRSKFYATRNTREAGTRRQIKVYLHKEVLRRFEPEPPTPQHTICDHKNGDSLDCRRANLRWATPSENGLNRFGAYARQGHLFDRRNSNVG